MNKFEYNLCKTIMDNPENITHFIDEDGILPLLRMIYSKGFKDGYNEGIASTTEPALMKLK